MDLMTLSMLSPARVLAGVAAPHAAVAAASDWAERAGLHGAAVPAGGGAGPHPRPRTQPRHQAAPRPALAGLHLPLSGADKALKSLLEWNISKDTP